MPGFMSGIHLFLPALPLCAPAFSFQQNDAVLTARDNRHEWITSATRLA
jgi:hypothetical protein